MEQDRALLHTLRVVGYINLAALVVVLLGSKSGWGSWLLVVLPPMVALCGATFYYLGWQRAFPQVSKAEGRRVMRPYLLGLYLLVAAAALVIALALIADQRGT